MNNQLTLLGARRFMPLFATQASGAFNDNLFKSAFVMLVTYGTARSASIDPGVLAALAGGALIAPFFLFSALAGELAGDPSRRAGVVEDAAGVVENLADRGAPGEQLWEPPTNRTAFATAN